MNTRVTTWMRRQPILAFYLLAFAITWLGWVPQAAHSHGLFPFDSPIFYILGGVGPLLAAYLVLRALRGGDALNELFSPLFRWRVGGIWYVVAFVGYPAIWLATLGLSGSAGEELGKIGPLSRLIPAFLVYVVAAIPEEVAWRGFALPRLQARHNALMASLIVGALWAIWHLPLLLTQGTTMSTYPWLPFFLCVVARSVLYTWMYNSTQGSLVIVTLFHAVSNTVGTFVAAEVLVTGILAALLIVVYGPARLAAGPRLSRHTLYQEKLSD